MSNVVVRSLSVVNLILLCPYCTSLLLGIRRHCYFPKSKQHSSNNSQIQWFTSPKNKVQWYPSFTISDILVIIMHTVTYNKIAIQICHFSWSVLDVWRDLSSARVYSNKFICSELPLLSVYFNTVWSIPVMLLLHRVVLVYHNCT